MNTHTYKVRPLDGDICPGCDEEIVWSSQTHIAPRGRDGGQHLSTSGACTCGEWSEHRDEQNRPGDTWYRYSPAPWGYRPQLED